MKLNFWQWLGVIVLLVAVPIYVYLNYFAEKKPSTPNPESINSQSGHQAASESEYFETTGPAQ